MHYLEVKNLTKIYKKETILDDVSFSLPPKGLFFIVGPSGCGKSTLLKCLMGIEKMDKGEIYLEEKRIKNFEDFRNAYTSFVYQNYNLVSFLSPYENVNLKKEISKKDKNANIDKLLEKFKINNRKDSNVDTLSGGEKQRFALARGIIGSSKIIFCDEPTGSLDEKNGYEVMNMLKKISLNALVIVVSHNKRHVSKFADGVLEIKDHKVNINFDFKNEYKHDIKKTYSLGFIEKTKISLASLKKNLLKSILSIIALGISLSFFLLSICLSSSINDALTSRGNQYLNYNLLRVSLQKTSKIENSNFSLVKLNRLDQKEKINLSHLLPLESYHYDLSSIFGFYPDIQYPLASKIYYSNIEFVPYSSIMEENFKNDIEGRFPKDKTVIKEVLVNKEARKILQTNQFSINITKTSELMLENKSVIYDSFSISQVFTIVGVVNEFSLMSTPRIYYPIEGIETLAKGIKLNGLSSLYNQDITLYDRMSEITGINDTFSSQYLYAEIEDVTKVNKIYQRISSLKGNDFEYLVENEPITLVNSFKNMYESISQALIIFITISLIISLMLLCLCLYSFVNDYKKDIGIMRSLGIFKIDVGDIFLLQSLLIGTISFILSIILYMILGQVINIVLNGLIGINLFSLWPGFKNVFFLFSLLIGVTFISSLVSSYGVSKINIASILRED
jgi:putative ABC transport system permease protein